MTTTDQNIFKNLKPVDELTITFQINPSDVTYVNTLRRAILTEVETVGFCSDIMPDGSTCDVRVTKNNTPMTNEMLADRIGLIPIYADAEAWKKEKGDEKYSFHLHVKSESETPRDVFASDFVVKVANDEAAIPNSTFFHSDAYMQARFPGKNFTPMITTLKGIQPNQVPQEVMITATATVGRGRDHVRFSPVSQCSYKYSIDPNEDAQKAVFANWLTKTKKVNPDFGKEDVEQEKKKKLWREFQTMEIERCFLKDENDMPYSYDFTVETKGQMPCELIVARAIDALIEKCQKYTTMGSGDLPENITIQQADWNGIGFDFMIQGEDHTLGNLLQTWLDTNKMTDGKGGEGSITFAGYKIPHPLRDEMVFRMGFPQFLDKEKQERASEVSARQIFAEAAQGCLIIFRNWKVMWDAAINKKSFTNKPINTRKTLKVAKAPVASVPVEEESKVPEPAGISSEQPPVRVDKRRGTFWKNPL